MARASSFCEDQFTCSICLDVFSEPVSVPCGHNFCRACISRHWKDKKQCQCPLCNGKFNKELKLCVNTGFRDIVEDFKKHHMTDINDYLAKEGQVPCDCCLGDKFRASKTCLVCLTSYCETHLEPHQRVPTLMRHELTDPVQDLENKICKKHNRILDHFCRDDLPQICVLCTEQNGRDGTVLLDKKYEEKKTQMGKEMSDMQVVKLKRGKKAQKKKGPVQTERHKKDEAIANSHMSNRSQTHNKDPHEFNMYHFIPEPAGLPKDCFYIEVLLEWETGWYLAIIREPGKKTSKRNSRNGKSNRRFRKNTSSRHPHDETNNIFLIRKPDRVSVFLHSELGSMCFYNADTGTLLFTFNDCKIYDRIGLFFSPGPTEDCMSCVPLFFLPPDTWTQTLRRKAQKIKDRWAQSEDCVKYSIIIVVYLCFFYIFIVSISTHLKKIQFDYK